MSCGCRRPARVSDVRGLAAARARPAGGAVDDLEAVLHAVARRLLHARAGRVDDRSASSSLTSPVRRHGSIPASKQPSAFHRLPMPGDDPLVEQGVADRARRVVGAQPAQERLLVELGGEDVRAQAGEPLVEARPRLGHQLEHRAVELRDELARRGGSPARCCAAAASRASRTRHFPVIRRCEWITSSSSKRRNRCLPWASTLGDRPPCSRSGQRSRPKRGCGVCDRVRDLALQDGPDPVRRVVDGVALGTASEYGPRRDDARPSPHRQRCVSRGSPGRPR